MPAISSRNSPQNVLFLCTGNSCRSQMAEAIVNYRMGESWKAYSAGTVPAGYVHPKALQVLAEKGISHTGVSKHVDDLQEISFDLVVTVCDTAADDCPVWLGPDRRVHLSYPDPARASGTEEEILVVFRQVRDVIARDISEYLKSHTG